MGAAQAAELQAQQAQQAGSPDALKRAALAAGLAAQERGDDRAFAWPGDGADFSAGSPAGGHGYIGAGLVASGDAPATPELDAGAGAGASAEASAAPERPAAGAGAGAEAPAAAEGPTAAGQRPVAAAGKADEAAAEAGAPPPLAPRAQDSGEDGASLVPPMAPRGQRRAPDCAGAPPPESPPALSMSAGPASPRSPAGDGNRNGNGECNIPSRSGSPQATHLSVCLSNSSSSSSLGRRSPDSEMAAASDAVTTASAAAPAFAAAPAVPSEGAAVAPPDASAAVQGAGAPVLKIRPAIPAVAIPLIREPVTDSMMSARTEFFCMADEDDVGEDNLVDASGDSLDVTPVSPAHINEVADFAMPAPMLAVESIRSRRTPNSGDSGRDTFAMPPLSARSAFQPTNFFERSPLSSRSAYSCSSFCFSSPSGRRGNSPRRAATAQRLRAQRHLEEALQERRGAEVLRTALARATAAGGAGMLIQEGRRRLADLGNQEAQQSPSHRLQAPRGPHRSIGETIVSNEPGPASPLSTPRCFFDPRGSPPLSARRALRAGAGPIADGAPLPSPRVMAYLAEREVRAQEASDAALIEKTKDEALKIAAEEEKRKEALAREREAERRRSEARTSLTVASDAAALRRAVDGARRAGLAPEELAGFEVDLWVAEASERALEEAMRSDDPKRIRAAIEGAQKLKLMGNKIRRAEESLAASAARSDLRRRLDAGLAALRAAASAESAAASEVVRAKECVAMRLLPGISEDEQSIEADAQAKHEAAAAKASLTLSALEDLVEEGRRLGLPAAELDDCTAAARREGKRQAARQALRRATMEVRSLDVVALDLDTLVAARRRLAEAVNGAIEAFLPEEELLAAEKDRQKIHNAVEDRRGAVRVFIRIRPFVGSLGEVEAVRRTSAFTIHLDAPPAPQGAPPVASETAKSSRSSSMKSLAASSNSWKDGSVASDDCTSPRNVVSCNFDGVWAPGSQEEIFDNVRDLVQSAVDGFNVTVFAYGQTGAGKTFTMYGLPPERRRKDTGDDGTSDGLCPRAANEVFAIVGRNSERFEYRVTLSMVELYRNNFIDLLCPKDKKDLKIRNLPSGEVFLENLLEQEVKDPDDVQRLVRAGVRERHSRDTSMNLQSSRSHVLFMMKVYAVNRNTGAKHTGKLLFIDLAGSERVKRSEVTGDGLREAIEINRSLSALADVVSAIARGDKHVPYRNHELTQLLQDSLGGTAKTLTFVNLHPTACNREETAMSLQFAQRCKGVLNRPTRSGTPSSGQTAGGQMNLSSSMSSIGLGGSR